jgi:hypothetical protein
MGLIFLKLLRTIYFSGIEKSRDNFAGQEKNPIHPGRKTKGLSADAARGKILNPLGKKGAEGVRIRSR